MFNSYQQPEQESSKLLPRFGEFEEDHQDVSLASRAGADLSKAASTKSFRILFLLFGVVSILFSVSPSAVSGGSPSALRSQFTSLDTFEGPWTCPEGNKNTDGYCSACCPTTTSEPTTEPSASPSQLPTEMPTVHPSHRPSVIPTLLPTELPTEHPSHRPSALPSLLPTAVPTTAGPSYAPSSAGTTAGLLHRYSFNDGTAGDSISGLDATLMSGAYVADGRAYLVKSSSSYIKLPANVLGSTTSLSIEFWVRTTGTNTLYTRMFEIGPQQTNSNVGGLILYRLTSDNMELSNRFYGQTDMQSSSTFGTSDTDMHIVLTFSTASSVMTTKWYVNGALSTSKTQTFTSTKIDSTQGYLGRAFWSHDPYLSGSFNEFRVWSTVLSAEAVQLNYVNGPDTIV